MFQSNSKVQDTFTNKKRFTQAKLTASRNYYYNQCAKLLKVFSQKKKCEKKKNSVEAKWFIATATKGNKLNNHGKANYSRQIN